MSIEIAEREIEGITILDLRGRLVLGEATSKLQNAVDRLLHSNENRVILNLAHISTIDSTGLGVLVLAHTSFDQASGGLRLLNVQQRQLNLLVLTKLNTFFQLFDEEHLAIDSFFPERKPRTFDILDFVKSHEDEPGDFDPAKGGDDRPK